MIIKRKYVPFWKLKLEDTEAIEIFDKAFNESFVDYEGKEELYQRFLNLSLYQRAMDWAFRKLGDVIDGFEKLDKDKPYDNGFDLSDVNNVEIAWKDDDSLTLHLLNKFEDTKLIVKVVEIKNDNSKN